MPLLPYQEEPAARLEEILRGYGAALDASDTGVGKTFVAVHVAKRLGIPVGIVCPKSVIPSWRRVLEAEGVEAAFIINYEKLVKGGTPWLMRINSNFEWAFQGLCIFDEVHRCRSYKSLNSKILIAAWKTQHIRCLCLSATAAQNPMEMRALGYTLGLHKNYDFWPWVTKLGAKRNRWGGYGWSGSPEVLSGIHHQIFPAKGVRVTIKELGDKFPENQVIPEVVQVDDGESLEVYEEAAKELARLKAQERKDFPSMFTIQLRARQKVEILKVPVLVERARDLLDLGRSVVIFVNFNATLEQLAAELETTCLIRGQDLEGNPQSSDARQQIIDDFQSDRSHICIANIQAGGVGISLHDTNGNRPRVSLLAPTYNAMDLRQALGRIHRQGGKTPCQQYVLYAAGTIEERVCKSVSQKLGNLDQLNDDELSDGLGIKKT